MSCCAHILQKIGELEIIVCKLCKYHYCFDCRIGNCTQCEDELQCTCPLCNIVLNFLDKSTCITHIICGFLMKEMGYCTDCDKFIKDSNHDHQVMTDIFQLHIKMIKHYPESEKIMERYNYHELIKHADLD